MRAIDQPSIRKRSRSMPGKLQARILVLLPVTFALGLACGAYWHHRVAQAPATPGGAPERGVRLTDATRRVLGRLDSPVEIHYYAILPEAPGLGGELAFAERVDELLEAYERDSGGMVELTRHRSSSGADLDAASADGLKAFNLDRGEPCYLGLSLAQGDGKEVLPRISPQWESALEADITRAVLRVTGARPSALFAASDGAPDPGLVAEIRRAIPDLGSVSLEEGKRILRERSVEEVRTSVAELQKRVTEARRLLEAGGDGTPAADREAAGKELREAQAAQAAKLKEISSRLDARIAALEALKDGAPADR